MDLSDVCDRQAVGGYNQSFVCKKEGSDHRKHLKVVLVGRFPLKAKRGHSVHLDKAFSLWKTKLSLAYLTRDCE